MVRERTPARKRSRSQLGDSWVVESDGDDEHKLHPLSSAATQMEQPRRLSRPTPGTSPAPKLVMPSIRDNGTSASGAWEKPTKVGRGLGKARRGEHSTEEGNVANPYLSNGHSPQHESLEGAISYVKPIFMWAYDVTGRALRILKTPISFVLATWLFIGVLALLRNLVFNSVFSALSPICRIPGVSLLNLPICQSPIVTHYSGEDPPPARFDQLMTVQSKFEEVLQESAGGVSLPLDMKRGETSIRDLRQIVRFSQLHSRNELVLEFDGFIETARIASYDLQKFNSHVGRGVDNILSTARWTKRVLNGIVEQDVSRGAIASFFGNTLLAPFQPMQFTEDILFSQYIHHTRMVEDEINRLVDEAQALLLVLQNLEDRLDVIHGIAVRDDLHAQGGKEEVLSRLWTMLGGNRSALGKYNSQLQLLGKVNTYRQNAIAHVGGTLIRLQTMGAELEELRERVGGVELLGMTASVPFTIHIENIEMGVERLERARKGAKELENEELQRTLGRGNGKDRMIDEI